MTNSDHLSFDAPCRNNNKKNCLTFGQQNVTSQLKNKKNKKKQQNRKLEESFFLMVVTMNLHKKRCPTVMKYIGFLTGTTLAHASHVG